jgi:repressor LexA
METITRKHLETLIAIEDYIEANAFPPSFRDLVGILGLRSPAPVQSRLNSLINVGALSIVEGKARTLRVIIPSSAWREVTSKTRKNCYPRYEVAA